MALRFIGIDPDTGKEGSPTVWVDEESREVVVQGWLPDPATVREIEEKAWAPDHSPGVPKGEGVVRIPASMAAILREALDVIDRDGVR
ncbi:hypothetical protein ACIPW5_25720 [Streptomyces sp. NPDC090077]|uniref:hypothetical protein n=1 Tax=Streptomyces sp. NPDC090077 TaxID=3365938 RepID=UPI00381F00C2